MQLFRKKINPNKEYTMSEVIYLLNRPEFKDNYTSIEISEGKYNIITIEKSRELEKQLRQRKNMKNSFYERYQYTNNKTAEIIEYNHYLKGKQTREKLVDFNEYVHKKEDRDLEIG